MLRERPRYRPGLIAVATILSLLASACDGDGDGTDGQTPTPTGATTGGETTTPGPPEPSELTVAYFADPGFLAFETSGIATYTYTRLIYDGLFRIRPDTNSFGTVEPGVAESWEVSADGTEWTFHLRPGLTFTNGEELTSEDVQFSIEKLQDPARTASGFLGAIDSVETPDDQTVVITLTGPDPSFWVIVAEIIDVYPADTVQEVGDDAFIESPIGSGPYAVVEWRKNESVTFEANFDHWAGTPTFSRIEIRIIPETSTRVAELLAGNIDAAPIEVQNIPEVEGNSDLHMVTAPGPTINFVRLRFDQAPTDDVLVRQALSYAIDRQAIADTFWAGLADLPASVLPSTSFGATTSEPYPYDPDMAESLLADYGQPVSVDLQFGTSELNNDIAEAIGSYWEEVGVEVNLAPADPGVFIATVRGGIDGGGTVGPVSLGNWSGVTEPVLVYQFNILPSGVFGFANLPEVEDAVDEATSAPDDATREAALQAAEEACYEQVCWIPLSVPDALFGARSNVEILSQSEGVWDITTAAVT